MSLELASRWFRLFAKEGEGKAEQTLTRRLIQVICFFSVLRDVQASIFFLGGYA
jgi:hypothetical protein